MRDDGDLKIYIDSQLRHLIEPDTAGIRENLINKAEGVLMWLSLVIKKIRPAWDRGRKHQVEELVRDTPKELREVFRDMIFRNTPKYPDMRVSRATTYDDFLLDLQRILFAKQPLSPAQLRDAILCGVGETPETGLLYFDRKRKLPPSEATIDQYIIDCSKGLAETVNSGKKKIVFCLARRQRLFVFL